jgi:transposase
VPGPTPHYPPEFNREALKLYRSSERSTIPKVAEELGIASESLRRWISGSMRSMCRRARRAHHLRARGTEQAPARSEGILKQEREFLKKAAASSSRGRMGLKVSCYRLIEAERTAIFEYLETFYNTYRLHSALGYTGAPPTSRRIE